MTEGTEPIETPEQESHPLEMQVGAAIGTAAVIRIAEACQKHPVFAERVLLDDNEARIVRLMKKFKKESASTLSVEAVILAEVYEYLYDLNRGNFERSTDELFDIFAVGYRGLQHIDELSITKNPKGENNEHE